MLKKTSILLSSYNGFHCLYCPSSSSITNTTSCPQPRQTRDCGEQTSKRRFYATIRPERPQKEKYPQARWPDLPSAVNRVPTPYQILQAKQGAPYSKRRFYELAKIYHPDRHGHEDGHRQTRSLPGPVKMDRYRLIVAAHEILCDPIKRSAYDSSGAGWNGRPDHDAPKYHWAQNNGTRWSGFDTNDSPFRNATWEDWERWYQRDKGKQAPVYFSNGSFVILVITAVFLGGFGQSVRVGEYSNIFQRQVEMVHDDASKVLMKRRTESTGFESRHERLQNFLSTRDPQGHGIHEATEEGYRKLLPEPEICVSDGIYHRSHHHERNPNPPEPTTS